MAISFRPAAIGRDLADGRTFLTEGTWPEALACFDRVIARKPDFTDGHVGRTMALRGLGRLAEALVSYDTAIAITGADAGMISNRGMILMGLQRDAEALACFDDAIARDLAFASAHHNRALVLLKTQRLRAALASCDRAIALQPTAARFHGCKAVVLLQLGAYAEGWRHYEWRKRTENPAGAKDFPAPVWLGETDIAGQTLFIHAEQGLGDTLQFCRYAALLQAQDVHLVMSAPAPLLRLLLRSFPGVTIIDEDQTPDGFDLHCPMLSLPLAMGTTLDTIPATIPYLYPDADRVAQWHIRLAALPGTKIGLVWAGSPRPDQPDAHAIDKRRSITLAHYAGLTAIPGISLISLQKGGPAEQARTPPAGMVLHDWTDELDDFADTADLIAALDLVITVDTSVAHLAGALGKPVWILNRFDQCWRWLSGRTDSPWYPTARLFQQSAPGDWDGVMAEVCRALHQPFTRGQIASTVSLPSTT
jgi:Tfp pilus assembly protein PilF